MSQPQPKDVAIKPGVFTRENVNDPDTALRGSRCQTCGETFFPHRSICPRCRLGAEMAEVELSRAGVVHALTHVARTPSHYDAPYVLAKVDLPEGVRILSQIVVDSGYDINIGSPVELVIEPVFTAGDGSRVWGYRFRPVGPA